VVNPISFTLHNHPPSVGAELPERDNRKEGAEEPGVAR
jgi:hypothetical protein